ncbi:MAG: hypothetical protein QOE08_1412, partial [Thermoleophilaceae bacterium]|nr:hypothetical protein [Thermoleophilaceae bacterium]
QRIPKFYIKNAAGKVKKYVLRAELRDG